MTDRASLTQTQIMDLWRRHGGDVHGPRVETVTMPLLKFWGFVAELSRTPPADDRPLPDRVLKSPGQRHTDLMEAVIAGVREQHDAFLEDDDCTLIIASGVTPQTAYVKLDASAIADSILALIESTYGSSPRVTPSARTDTARSGGEEG